MIRRWLFNIAAATSLLLCLTVAGLSAWSYHRGIDAEVNWGSWSDRASVRAVLLAFHVDGGSWHFRSDISKLQSPMLDLRFDSHIDFDQTLTVGYHITSNLLGFHCSRNTIQSGTDTENILVLIVPGWTLLLATASLPFMGLRMRHRQRGLQEAKRCKACGYNLTANTSGVCPECGSPVRSNPGAVA